ncbi:efflux RND transporter periplasmic adaptor subunit [Pseudacidovorax sp. NFM-22]|uniref:efflux RND transporter periplasmic adaptor subunit n=1 Tax=Pseudacidovorax sp. NFM-22 TaxID=2744469 RepID=UPI001B16E4D7|nr:efflux RND transporter periplasmic adaptor subunit [Pseudacidovorax sp. NFM-22]MBO9643908.1 efflux RND transporter periplasmic adaptor subunit [Pseudacidovorax sp.]
MPASHVVASRSMFRPGSPLTLAATAVLLSLALVACGKKDAAAPAGGPPGGGMPAPEVGVVIATPGEVGLVTELPGRLEATRVAQVRARAAGILQKRLFVEGSDVKAGQPLFRIDASPYEATLRSAEATLARAEANAAQAKALADRYKPLVEANAVSKQDYANAVASQKAAEADVLAGRASVTTARINLGYATVTAPISGRIGRALVTEGALVGQGEATQLATIQQIDPLYVNFTQSATEVMRMRRAMAQGKLQRASGPDAADVRIVLEDGTEFAQRGRLLFSDLTVDASTGQITLRAEVPNPKGELLPGMYVRVRTEQAQVDKAISVPQQAVTRTDQGDTVTIVGQDGKLSKRNVKITAGRNNRWIVTEGLKEGEQVMVDGFQKLQMLPPGTPVKAVPWQPPTTAAAAPAAGASAPAAAAAPAKQ